MAYLSKQQVKDIITKAPQGTKPEDIVHALIQEGHQLEGFGEQPMSKTKILEKAGGVFQKAGEMFLNPVLKAVETGVMQPIREVQKIIPGGKTGAEEYNTPFGVIKDVYTQPKSESVMQAIDIASAGLPVEKLLKTPLTKVAEKLYQTAMKPGAVKVAGKVVVEAKDIVKIGLDEGVWLTKGGVERVATKIDDFEDMLGKVIDEAKQKGVTISTKGLKSYLAEAKKFFSNQFNVEDAKKSVAEIDAIGNKFIKEFGDNIPIEKAQEIKVATGQALRKYYDKMSSAGIEGTKQGVRYLKDKIVEAAPQAGNINQRLSNLYKFDQALQKASGRIGNLNLLGLPSKIGGAVAGAHGAVVGKLMELLDAPSIKSGLAIGLDRLAKGGQTALKGVKIPLSNLINHIVDEINDQDKTK
jgi:hypothetical protein